MLRHKQFFFTASSRKQNNNQDVELGRPIKRVAGKGRNPCLESLIALVPGSGNIDLENKCSIPSYADLAYTSDFQPTFWVYIPESITRKARFVLIDDRRSVANFSCNLPQQSGLVSFKLPNYKLQSGNVYEWQVSLLNNPKRPTDNPNVGGKIKLDSQSTYFWYDDVTSLANQLLQTNNSNVKAQWSNLLGSSGLNQLTNLPVVGECTPE